MDPLSIIIWSGYIIVMMVMIVVSAKVISSEEIGLGCKNVLLTLISLLAFIALITFVWIASNLELWLRQ